MQSARRAVDKGVTGLILEDLRRDLGSFHDELRNAGRNPLEAVALLASLLTSDERTRQQILAELPERARDRASVVLRETRTGGAAAVAFQELLISEARSGLGQYLTPLPVAELVGEVVGSNVQVGLGLDPFCGSGLLLESLGRHAPEMRLLGIEINWAVATVAQALSGLTPQGVEVRRADAFLEWCEGRIPEADAVVANPPFGGLATSVSLASLASAGVPAELLRMRAIPAELLGLELCMAILREKGTLAIVLPQSVISNRSWSPYRASVFRRLEPQAIVSLPEETFAPFRGVAKSVVLIGQRRDSELPSTSAFYRSRSIGYDANGREAKASDLPQLTERIVSGQPDSVADIDTRGEVHVPSSTRSGQNGEATLELCEVADIMRGKNPGRDTYETSGPWILKVGDLTGSFVEWRPRPKCYIRQSFFDKNPSLHLRVGDICLTGAGHKPKYIGLKVDLMDWVPAEGALPSGEVLLVRVRPEAPILPEVLLFYLRGPDGYGQIQDLVRGSTGHLYPADLSRLELPTRIFGKHPELSRSFGQAADYFRAYREREDAARALAHTALQSATRDGSSPTSPPELAAELDRLFGPEEC